MSFFVVAILLFKVVMRRLFILGFGVGGGGDIGLEIKLTLFERYYIFKL